MSNTEIPKYFPGETATLEFEHKNAKTGTLIDATTSAKIVIVDAKGKVMVPDTTDLDHGDTGKYSYEWSIPASAHSGVYTAQGIFTSGTNVNRQGTQRIEVLEKLA